jgi:hypothetical protein
MPVTLVEPRFLLSVVLASRIITSSRGAFGPHFSLEVR